jgi:AraC family transcriptional activator FtrA
MIDLVRDNPANTGVRAHTPFKGGRGVAVLVYDGVAPLELGVACDVFGPSSERAMPGVPWYQLSVCGHRRAPVKTDTGYQLVPPYGLGRVQQVGTVVVPPTYRPDEVPDEVYRVLRRAHARGCRIISLCTGAFVLARAGLLEGRRATTHWEDCADLVADFPNVTVDAGVLFVDDGDILTSAGSAASLDLCLHVVRQDMGSEVATQLARQLVVPPQRDGGQAQFIDTPLPPGAEHDLFADTVIWAQEHLDQPLSVADMAGRAAMSPRTFARRFVEATGTTPHQWLQMQRVRRAQRLLEVSDLSIDAVAEHSGFGTPGNLRKHFTRTMRTSPQGYRRTFAQRAG